MHARGTPTPHLREGGRGTGQPPTCANTCGGAACMEMKGCWGRAQEDQIDQRLTSELNGWQEGSLATARQCGWY